MYVIADKYDISALNTAAKGKFETLADEFANTFTAVLSMVLEIVPSANKSIRLWLANFIVEDVRSLLVKKDFINVLWRTPRLQTSIIICLVNGAPATKIYECYSCKETWKLIISNAYTDYPKCGDFFFLSSFFADGD